MVALLRILAGAFIASEASSGRYPRPVSMFLAYLVTRGGGLSGPIATALFLRDMMRGVQGTDERTTPRAQRFR